MLLSACTDSEEENDENDRIIQSRQDRKRLRSPFDESTSNISKRRARPTLIILGDVNSIRHDDLGPSESSTSLAGTGHVLPSPEQHALNEWPQSTLAAVKVHHSSFCVEGCCDR